VGADFDFLTSLILLFTSGCGTRNQRLLRMKFRKGNWRTTPQLPNGRWNLNGLPLNSTP
jgi:hypothetical protein